MPKPKVVDPEVVVTPSLEEAQAEVTLPAEEAKAEEKVECPDCGKMMSQKALRRGHGQTCVVKKQEQPTHAPEAQKRMLRSSTRYNADATANEMSEQLAEKLLSPSLRRMPSDFPTHKYIHLDGPFA